jgi:hypothetical protein
MEKAAFKLDDYRFTKASLDFNIPDNAELNISFSPKGVFHAKEARYELDFDVMVGCTETNTEVVKVSCVASFSFGGGITIADIPRARKASAISNCFMLIILKICNLNAKIQNFGISK